MIGISIFFGALLLLLAFLVIKLCYLKHRRIQTIHRAPVPDEKISSENDEEQESGESRLGSEKSVAQDQKRSSWLSRLSSGGSERKTINGGSIHVGDVNRHSAPGIVVGFLGSPDWETNMVRKVADHQWRQRRAPKDAIDNWRFRHTWHSNPGSISMPDNRSQRTSSLRIVPHTSRREGPQMAHVTSFGEIHSARMRRQQSLSAVVEGFGLDMNTPSASPYGSNASPIYYSANSRAYSGTGTFASPQHSFSHRPSTITEEATPNTTGFQTTTTPRILLDCPSNDSLQSTTVPLTQPVFRMDDPRIVAMEPSTTYATMNGSAESSAASSFGNLPSFPSPPLSNSHSPRTSFVGTVLVNPVYIKDGIVGMFSDDSVVEKSINKVKDFEAMLFDLHDNNDEAYKPNWTFPTDHSDLFFRLDMPPPTELPSPQNAALSSLPSPKVHSIKDFSDKLDADVSIDFASALLESSGGILSERMPFGSITNIEHREHARVRSQIPFSLVLPPKAYLGSLPRVEQPGKVMPLTRRNSVGCGTDQRHLMPICQNASQPLRPSPLRKAISLSTISSRFSGGSTLDRTLLSIEQELASSIAENAAESSLSAVAPLQANDNVGAKTSEEVAAYLQPLDGPGVTTSEEEYVSEFYSFSSAGTIASFTTESE